MTTENPSLSSIMGSRLKYRTEIDNLKLENCPRQDSTPKDCEGFRFCFDSLNHQDTWITQAEKQKRTGVFPRENTKKETICDLFGLSFYNSERSARAAWQNVNSKMKEKMGYKKLMAGRLFQSDGLCTTTHTSGHFNLFEFDNCNLSNRFQIVSVL